MATDEIAGAVMSAAQKGIDVLAEIIKLLAQATPKLFGGAVDITKFFEDRANAKKAVGSVSRKDLLVAANNSKTAVVSSDNFLDEDAHKIAAKAKKYGIPVAVIGSGEKQTISYLESDKAVVNQILSELVQERIKESPESVKSFSISEGGVSAMKAQLDANNIDCSFVQSADGKYHCIYPADKAAQVEVLKQDYKNLATEVGEKFKVDVQFTETENMMKLKEQISELSEQYEDELQGAEFAETPEEKENTVAKAKEYYEPRIEKLQSAYNAEKEMNKALDGQEITLSDGENSISITADDTLTRANITARLQEDFGYSEAKADMAASKLCDDLGLDRAKFNVQPTQTDNIEFMRTNVRYENDDLTVRDMTFSSVKFKDGEDNHIFITNGENTAAVTPSKMSVSEMKNICVQHLGMSEEQANAAVQKSVKIDTQINSKLRETTFNHDGTQQTAEIQRTSNSAFTVRVGEKVRSYTFSTINVEDKIANDFGMSQDSVKNVINKAKKQSVLQNNIKNAADKMKKKTGEKLQEVKPKHNKGARK